MKTITLSANTSWYLYNFRASTIREFINQGFRVVCLSPRDGYEEKLQNELGCDWYNLPMDNQGNNPFRDLVLLFRFWRLYRSTQPAVAFHFTVKNNVYGTWAARLLGIPAVNNVSGLGTAFIRPGLVGKIVRLMYKTSMPLAHRVFCQNEEDYRLLIESELVPEDRLRQLPGSGVNLQRFQPVKERNNPIVRFLYAGRMLADKGLYELMDAMRELNRSGERCELWLCGFADAKNISAITESELENWGQRRGVKWLGPTDDMASIYRQVDCVVLPSYREGMPRSLLEAGAMGLPSIATDVPGCRNIIQHNFNGFLCEVKSSESLRGAMSQFLHMSLAERLEMGENARERVEQQFDERIVVDAAIDAVQQALAS